MRWFMVGIVVLGLLAARPARAQSKADVEKVVRAHVTATTGKQGALIATLGDPYILIDASGNYLSLFADCEMDPKSPACDSSVQPFGQSWFGTLRYSKVKPRIRVDEASHTATFYVTADLAGELWEQGREVKGKTQMRIAGIAKLDKTGWKIVAAKYAASLPDKALFTRGQTFNSTAFAPKPGIETEVTSWFGHLADHQSASALGANGTGPAEVATDRAGMAKLARSWDKLDIKPHSYGVQEVGDVAFVTMDVTLTTKKKAVDLSMAVVTVKEGGVWRWVAIEFGASALTEASFR